MSTRYYVGTSGWHYGHWRDLFYPHGLPIRSWLSFYAERFSSVEVNGSFYRLPSELTMQSWREETPEGFVFALKASRQITHYRKLRDAGESIERFLGRARLLGEKLGPLLYQLPASMERDDARLQDFLAILPSDLAHVVEFRHASWLHEDVFRILRRYGVALCAVDSPSFNVPLVLTAPHAYVRFHGPSAMYAGLYSEDDLRHWAHDLRSLAGSAEAVYAYFNNDERGYAVVNALELAKGLGVGG